MPPATSIPPPRGNALAGHVYPGGSVRGDSPRVAAVQSGYTTIPARQISNSMPRSESGEVETRVRGPRNRRPLLLRFVGFIHLVRLLSFIGTVLGVPLVLVFMPEHLPVALVFPILLVASGVVWLFGAAKVGCRVCAMRMYRNKPCVKSRKAPSIPLLGPHTTLALLALCSGSVRCPYCGTPNSLTEKED